MSGPTREYCQERELRFRIQGYHLLWPAFPDGSASAFLCNSPDDPAWSSKRHPTTPDAQRTRTWHTSGLGWSPFARRYLGSRGFFLFLSLLRCFTSARFASRALFYSSADTVNSHGRLSHRKSPDQCLLAAPRGLSQLTTSFVASWRQDIPRAPLVA